MPDNIQFEPKRGSRANLDSTPFQDGTIYLTTDSEELFADVAKSGGEQRRIPLTVKERELTQAQYDALTEAEKNDGTVYYIADATAGGLEPHFIITAPTGSTVTLTKGSLTLTPTEQSGTWEQDVPSFGTWRVQASLGNDTAYKDVKVKAMELYEVEFSFLEATIVVASPIGTSVTVSGGGTAQTQENTTGTNTFTVTKDLTTYTISGTRNGKTKETSVSVNGDGIYPARIRGLIRYGYRKKKAESNPSTRVTYLYDAEDMTPAHVDLTTGEFDPGSWGNVWFMRENRPVMLNSDGTVAYEFDHDDHTKKLDGTASDVANTAFDGNAMSELPLAYFYRYEDSTYEYEIVSDGEYDENYVADAHTMADGTISDVFYWSMFGGSIVSGKMRSLSGLTLSNTMTAQQEIDAAVVNCKDGSWWYTHTWSQHEYIRTLLVLIGKSTNTQAVFGTGNLRSASSASGMLSTGTTLNKGQFYGKSSNTEQVKVLYIEQFWGDRWDRVAGSITSNGTIYVKLTPEGSGYRVTDTTGYTNTSVKLGASGSGSGWISVTRCGRWGCLPTTVHGSETTYECDQVWYNHSVAGYLIVGGSSYNATGAGGAFAFQVSAAPSTAIWDIGASLSAFPSRAAA